MLGKRSGPDGPRGPLDRWVIRRQSDTDTPVQGRAVEVAVEVPMDPTTAGKVAVGMLGGRVAESVRIDLTTGDAITVTASADQKIPIAPATVPGAFSFSQRGCPAGCSHGTPTGSTSDEVVCTPCEPAAPPPVELTKQTVKKKKKKKCTICGDSFFNLKIHKADKHGVGVSLKRCNVDGCGSAFKRKHHLQTHMALVHGVGTVLHQCDVDGCSATFKTAGNLNQHKANIHNIGVVWHHCQVEGCKSRFKQTNNLKDHMANAHDVGVVWHTCNVDGCAYRAKQSGHLTQHIKSQHSYVYTARMKKQEERIRKALVNAGYDEYYASETMPPIGSFKREKRIDFTCAVASADRDFCRIDFVVAVPSGFVFLEVDEDQHKFGYDGMVSCDMKRMSNVMSSIVVELGDRVPNIFWLRYNPNAWRVGGELRSVPKGEREAALVRWLQDYDAEAPLQIGYAFYDCDESGSLAVLDNEEYHEHFAVASTNLWDLK